MRELIYRVSVIGYLVCACAWRLTATAKGVAWARGACQGYSTPHGRDDKRRVLVPSCKLNVGDYALAEGLFRVPRELLRCSVFQRSFFDISPLKSRGKLNAV